MRIFIVIAIFGFMLAGLSLTASSQTKQSSNPSPTTFFHTLNDVPVMPGLRELPDEGVNFDKPEGRIMSATAVSETITPAQVKSFYEQALPQLGWTAQPDGSFLRDQERLKLIIEVKEGVSIIRLQVEPR